MKLDMKEKTPGELPLIRPDALEKAFVQMDRDKSGELNQEEVNDVLRELGYTTVESKCLFDHMDIDHNGKITKSEFVRGCVSEGICAIDDDPINYEDGEHVVVSNDDREPEENITMLGFYTRLLQYTEKKTQVLGEAGEVKALQDEEEFNEIMAAAGDKPIIVKFYAEWCRKCIAMRPKFLKLAAAYGEQAVFVKMDIEKFGELAKNRAGVVAIPTFMVWKEGKPVDKYVAGSVISKVPGEIARMIDRNLQGGFSLLEEISAKGEKGEQKTEEAEVKVELGQSQVNMDAMSKWRAAQAAKNQRR